MPPETVAPAADPLTAPPALTVREWRLVAQVFANPNLAFPAAAHAELHGIMLKLPALIEDAERA